MQVVSFSGGRTSAYLCHLMLERFDRSDLRFVFMDTGAEHPATYDFVRRVDVHFGLDLECLRCDASAPLGKGVSPYRVPVLEIGPDLVPFRDVCAKYGTPSPKTPQCTRDMKEVLFRKWNDAQHGRHKWAAWIGVRVDEPKRLSKMGASPRLRYLAELDDADKQDVLAFWREMPFDLEIPEHLGNCVFCVKKSATKLALAVRDEPELAAAWMGMLRSAPDRLKRDGRTSEHVYRGHRSLPMVCAEYADVPTETLRSRIRSSRNDANTCGESCEVFVGQLDLFNRTYRNKPERPPSERDEFVREAEQQGGVQ